jgi:hypothetical protein
MRVFTRSPGNVVVLESGHGVREKVCARRHGLKMHVVSEVPAPSRPETLSYRLTHCDASFLLLVSRKQKKESVNFHTRCGTGLCLPKWLVSGWHCDVNKVNS